MTTMTEDNKSSLMRQKLRGKKVETDENRAFINISRENLSISNSDIEQGFNKSRFRINRATLFSLLALLIATICMAIEICKFQQVLDNARDIRILRRDVDTLKHRFLEEDLLDELKAFEQQLYSEDGKENPNLDQDDDDDYSNYDDYSDEYSSGSGNGQQNRPNFPPGSDKDLKETMKALYEAEAKRGEEFVKKVRESRKNIERERLLKETHDHYMRRLENETHTTKKRSVEQDDEHVILTSHLYNQTENDGGFRQEEEEVKEKHHHKKYLPTVREPHTYLSSLLDVMKTENKEGFQTDDTFVTEKTNDRRKITNRKKKTQTNELSLRLQRREMSTPRHLRAPKQVFAVHYEADSTLFSNEDEHTGNGRAKHNAGVFKAWRPSSWVQEFNTNNHFTLNDGRVTVHEPGLYLAYAQIHYLDEHDENGFHMLVNGRPIFQCMLYSPGFGHKSRSCFSSQITLLKSGDHIVLRDVGSARYTLFQRDKSFFGLVKLADIRQPQRNQHQSSSSVQ